MKNDQSAALVVIPAGFSDDLRKGLFQELISTPVSLAIYANPERPISVSILETVLGELLSQIQAAPLASWVIVFDLLASKRISQEEVGDIIPEGCQNPLELKSQDQPVTLLVYSEQGEQSTGEVNQLAYFAPAMAVFFLMFTVTQGWAQHPG